MKHVNTIACAVQHNIKNNGTYIPPGLVKAVPLRAALDNIDAKVDTPDGKSSFHALAGTIFQNKSPISDGNTIELVTPAINVDETSVSTLKNIPVTGIELVECTIIGNPKPKSSPHYPDFKPMSHTHSIMQAAQQDMAWLLIRHYSRKSLDMDLSTETTDIADMPIESAIESFNDCERSGGNKVVQSVPVWSAYNSMLASSTMEQENTNVDNVHPLPLINSPPQDWKTLVTSLEQLHKVNRLTMGNDGNEPVCVWLDMDLYKRVLKLAYLKPELYKDKWLESPGQFHICLCAIRFLGRTLEGSGLDDMLVESGVYSNVTVMQIINGKHYNRAIECHQFTLEALASLWFDTFFEANPNVLEILRECANTAISSCETHVHVSQANTALLAKIAELNLVNLMEEFDAAHDQYPNYKWLRMYMRQVSTLLQLLRSIRLRQWDLYLASLEQMCIWFFAYNRLDYAMNIPEYVARMYSLRETHPAIWNHFEQGYFTVNTNKVPFSAIGVDQAQEHVNRVHKGDGGIIGITNNPNTLMKYCLSTPELTRLSKETENMLDTSHEQSTHHHDMSQAKVVRKEKYIALLKTELSQAHPFNVPDTIDGTEHKLVHMTKKVILPDNVAQSILDTEKRGEERYIAFVEERLCGDKNLWDTMTKLPILGWDAGTKPLKTKVGERELVMKESSSMMARLLVIARSSREIDLKTVIGNHEFSTTNRMLMTPDGQLHPCSDKSQLIHRLTDIPTVVQTSHINPIGSDSIDDNEMGNVTDSTIPENACLLIDGMAIVQEQTVFKEVIRTCSDLADRVIRAVHNRSSGYASTCIVFDNYTVSSSLKESTRNRRAKGRISYAPTFQILDETQIKDFSTFLASSQTKDMMTIYLSRKLVNQLTMPTTTVTRVGVLSNSVMTEDHLHGNHEEADTLLILHATDIHKKGVPVHIYSPDTDVLVLAVSYFPQLGDDATMVMGTSSNHRYIPLIHIYNGLGENRARALLRFHSLSGCDTTGRIFGKSKTSWWNTFLSANDSVDRSSAAWQRQ